MLPGTCVLCGEETTWQDLGYYAQTNPMHRECALRSVLGGIGHLEDHQRWCIEAGDPDGGRSYRQSALEVDEWVHRHGIERLT